MRIKNSIRGSNKSKNLIRIVILLSVIAAAGWLGVPARADEGNPVDFTPENTVILSNQTDYDFCMDFSVLLKNLTVEWIILDSAEIPESAKDKHLILVGGLDSKYTSEIISEMLTPDEMNFIQQRGFLVIEDANPWAENHIIYISAGMDNLLTKQAAEEAVQRMLTAVSRRGDWLFPVANITRDEVMEYISPLQYLAEGDELSQDALRVDFDAKPPRKITLDEAVEDVEHFFYLLSHGYCGYGYFQTEGDFGAAKINILNALESQSNWTPNDLAATISSELSFIHDCHLNLGRQKFCGHLDFWYDANLELWKYQGGYYFTQDAIEFRVLSVNGNPPENFVFPSLNEGGDPIYRLGVLSYDAPSHLNVAAESSQGQESFEIPLSLSDFYDSNLFGEERIGGIPVLRVRSFADYYHIELDEFLQTANKYRGEPYLIIDIRGNTGGNTNWPQRWITRFTGQSPSMKQVLIELISKTSMMGRVNVFEEMLKNYREEDADWIQTEIDQYTAKVNFLERPDADPHWTSPYFPGTQLIPNDTTLIVIVDREVASSGEGLLSFLHQQVENVVVVGENSRGALTFGQVSRHQLPNSKLMTTIPIKLNAMLDLEWREEIGFSPDLWVPAEYALNYAVAAARQGTLTTQTDLPDGYFDAVFTPEKIARRTIFSENKDTFMAIGLLLFGGILIVILRNQKLFFIIFGASWIVIGIIVASKGQKFGYWLIPYGTMFFFRGIYKWRQARAKIETEDAGVKV